MTGAAALLAAGLLAAPGAAPAGSAPPLPVPPRLAPSAPRVTVPPRPAPGAQHHLSARRALAIAGEVVKVRAVRARHRGTFGQATFKAPGRWKASFYTPGPQGREVAQVFVQDATGRVLEAWTGFQVAWTMARGYPGAFGKRTAALWVWLPLCTLFLAPWLPWRRMRGRPRRRRLGWLHADIAVLLSLSVSFAFFNHGAIGLSVPLVYPVLLYLLARMLVLGRRSGRATGGPLPLTVPAAWLAVALVFLVGFRVGLNVLNSNVIDVGYAGVVGADRLGRGQPLYGHFPKDIEHGDTYGPASYLAYVPFEQAFPWSGRSDDLSAAHAAAILFDLLTLGGLWLLGRRVRGPTLGLALAWCWAACPFTLFVANTNGNDGLVAVLVVATLLVAGSPPARGAVVALAGLTKFGPLALVPLLARVGPGRRRRGRGLARELGLYAAGMVGTAVLVWVTVTKEASIRGVYDRTLGYQDTRGSPFSVWGLWGGLGAVQAGVKIAAVALALALALVPGRRDVVRLAALGAAVLIALQLGVTHWFYLYVAWFLPLVLLALFGSYREPAVGPAGADRHAEARRLSAAPVPAPAPAR